MTPGEASLAAYDEQVRARITAAETASGQADRDGPAIRKTWAGERGLITYRHLGGLAGPALDAFIARQRDHFARLGDQVEWKYHSHDRPADLPDRLVAAGFLPEDPETLLIGESVALAADPDLPAGLTLREVTEPADLERIGGMEQAVWGDDRMPASLGQELTDPDDPCAVIAVEAGQQVVCAGWIRFHRGTDFASLWGSSTLPAWRRRGVYRGIVGYRARLAVAAGFRYIQVDASADSRPILTRLGLLPVATTTPYVWKPAGGGAPKEPADA